MQRAAGKKILSILIVILSYCLPSAFAADVFTWTDEKGTTYFADSVHQVPERFRNQIRTKTLQKNQPADESRSAAAAPAARGRPREEAIHDPNPAPTLNRYEVPFVAYEGSARRIIIQVTFNDAVTVPMALDTGAPGLIISPQLAERLGVFGKKDEAKLYVMAGGIGGRVPAVVDIIDRVQVGGAKVRFVPATVTSSVSASFEGLIGMDFVSNYTMKVDSGRRVVILEELPPNPGAPGGREELWWRSLYGEFGTLREGWREFGAAIEKKMTASMISAGPDFDILQKVKEFSGTQYRAADTLLAKLDRYANENQVPTQWRQY